MNESAFSLLELFGMGGVFMWPLLAFSVATLAIIVERAVFLLSRNFNLDDIRKNTLELIRSGDIEGAKKYIAGLPEKRAGAAVVMAMLNHSALDGRFIEKAGESAALRLVNSLEAGFSYLTALGSLSPLTGFLGTVSGMIGAFRSIAQATEVNAQIVANGIYEALITTVFGLIIAIIAMVGHSILSNSTDNFAANLEDMCSDIITEMEIQRASAEKKEQL